jgi:hypothetical protein
MSLSTIVKVARSAFSVGRPTTAQFIQQQALRGQSTFFLPRSFLSRQSFELQSNHQKMLSWLQEQGLQYELIQHEQQDCEDPSDWLLNPDKRKYHPVFATSVLVTIPEEPKA